MLLELKRNYFPEGSNGTLKCDGKFICFTIELPWRNNERRISCIPEGKYFIKKRNSQKFKSHFILLGVPNRSLILIHPANNAMKELNGCIAPVTKLSGPGMGLYSRAAFLSLKSVLDKALEQNEEVVLNINH